MEIQFSTTTGYLIKLIRAQVGSEKELFRDLKKINKNSLFFKAIGSYDIVEVTPLKSLQQIVLVNCDRRILSINYFPCFCLSSPASLFSKALSTTSLSSLILLKLQDNVFKDRGIDAVLEVAKHIQSKGGPCKVFPFVGLGFYELMVWVNPENITDIFNYLDSIRDSRIKNIFKDFSDEHLEKTLLVDTITLPCISYNNVITKKLWGNLKGKISPIVKIKCAPGHEISVAKKIKKLSKACALGQTKTGTSSLATTIGCYDVLGSDDLFCYWKEPQEYSDFVKFILRFREKSNDNTVTCTVTALHRCDPVTMRTTTKDNPPPPAPGMPTLHILSKLEELTKQSGINHFLIGELTNLMSMINTQIGNHSFDIGCYEVIYSILTYLNGILNTYTKIAAVGNQSQLTKIEGKLMAYAHFIRTSLNQQFFYKGYSENAGGGAFPSLANSLYRIIKGISLIPEQLFGLISQAPPPKKFTTISTQNEEYKDQKIQLTKEYKRPWLGFIFLDLSDGYRIIDQAEIISVPYKDTFNFLNWITLSHEISHGYYVRILFNVIERDYIDDLHDKFSKKFSENTREYILRRRDTVFELFAHWFDFTHFFNRDIDFYLWSIWRTHIDNPRVHEFKKDYWARSLFVRISYRWKKILPELIKNYEKFCPENEYHENIIAVFVREFELVYNYIKEKFPDSFHSISLTDDEKHDVARMFFLYHDFCRVFEGEYINNALVKKTNHPYPGINDDIENIIAGKIIQREISNPFLLLREILRYYYENGLPKQIDDKVTLAVIFSFWETSRKYSRQLHT